MVEDSLAYRIGRDRGMPQEVDGAVRCWGRGTSGQLGYGNEDNVGDDETPESVGATPVG